MITELFDKPKVMGVLADVNEGKSNFLYHIIKELTSKFTLDLYVYGLRKKLEGTIIINSLVELEAIRNSVIILDEFANLFDLDDRKKRRQIENTLRLIHHNNNILLLCGIPENFKKFISAKLSVLMYKRVTYDDLINGSRAKRIITDYSGDKRGSYLLNMEINEVLIFTDRYDIIEIPYLEEFDTKKGNMKIVKENLEEIVESPVQESTETEVTDGEG